jgi:transposase
MLKGKCGKVEHFKRDCRQGSFKRRSGRKTKPIKERANVAKIKEFGLAMVGSANPVIEWIIDSGATRYLCNDLSLLSNQRTIAPFEIYVGSGKYSLATMTGSAKVTRTHD